jgi:cell fate (sporulation/competence/biofilm development) regulator YlbF (YheA/YmcA/DUF963 family)
MKILTQVQESPIVSKAKELCQTILDQSAYQDLRRAIDAFLQSPASVARYQELCDRQDFLRTKQESGVEPSNEEWAGFEKLETAFLEDTLSQQFIEAQRKLQHIEQTIQKYVRRTFELGRVPTEDDFDGCCGGGGGGCGCH